jgi:molecular chaperone Hsp33
VTAIEGESLSLCAEQYFAQSEQVPTRVRLAVGQLLGRRAAGLARGRGDDPERGGGRRRGLTRSLGAGAGAVPDHGRRRADRPGDRAETLLFRLFHEDGVRLFEPRPLRAFCRCSDDRILGLLRSFAAEERTDMVEPSGVIR